MANSVIMQWGALQFRIWPLNFDSYDHQTGSAYARKEVMEAIPQREWVGEDDEEIVLRGQVLPYRIGGAADLDTFDKIRRQGIANQFVRGDGFVLGWYVCERMMRRHQFVSIQGVGRLINFEAQFSRCDTPIAADYFVNLLGSIKGG